MRTYSFQEDQFKKQLDEYAYQEIVAPAYKIHADQLKRIEKRAKDNDEILRGSAKDWVFQGEKLRGEQIEISVPDVINVAHLIKFMDDLVPPPNSDVVEAEVIDKPDDGTEDRREDPGKVGTPPSPDDKEEQC